MLPFNRTAFVALLLCSLLQAACGGGTSSRSPSVPLSSVETTAYNGPGSKWDVQLQSDGTFVIQRREAPEAPIELTVEGTFETLDSGFLELTVTSASGAGGPATGEVAWALEVPNFALFLNVTGVDDREVVAMVEAGACPDANLLGNWVTVRTRLDADAADADQDFFGAFAYDVDAAVANLPARYPLAGSYASLGDVELENGDCTDGILLVDDAAMYMTAGGGALVHTNRSDPDESHIIFAVPQETIDSINVLDGDFIGMVFEEESSGTSVTATTLSCSSGLCNGVLIESISSDAEVLGQYDLNFSGTLNFPEPGMLTGEIVSEGETGVIACAVATAPGDSRLVSCVGQAAGNNASMFNIVFAQT